MTDTSDARPPERGAGVPHQRRPRVLLADDHAGLLAALRRLLALSCEIVGQATDGAALMAAVTALAPDVVVLDVSLPDVNGIEGCRRIRQARPEVKVVILTAADDPGLREKAFEAGASAFVLKHSQIDRLLPAIHDAFRGEPPVD